MGALVEYIQNVQQINSYDDKSKEFGTLGDGRGKPISLDPDDANTKRLLACRAIVTKEQVSKTSQGAKVLAGEPVDESGAAGDSGGGSGAGDDEVAVVPDEDAPLADWKAYATNPNGGGLSEADVKSLRSVKAVKALLGS